MGNIFDDELCDCGQPVAHVEKIQVKERTTEKLPLCESCYQLFLEIENR